MTRTEKRYTLIVIIAGGILGTILGLATAYFGGGFS